MAKGWHKEKCKRGHYMIEANVYITPSGQRQCRACKNLKQREFYRESAKSAAYRERLQGYNRKSRQRPEAIAKEAAHSKRRWVAAETREWLKLGWEKKIERALDWASAIQASLSVMKLGDSYQDDAMYVVVDPSGHRRIEYWRDLEAY